MFLEIDKNKNYIRNKVKVDIYATETQYISELEKLMDDGVDKPEFLRTITIYDTPIDEITQFIDIAIDRIGLGEGSRVLACLTPDLKKNVVLFLCTKDIDLVHFNREFELEAPITFNSGEIHYFE